MVDILPQLLFNSLITGSIYALASAGLSLTYGLTRILNFAHGHLMMAGAYALLFLRVERQLPLFPSALGAAVVMAGLGIMTLVFFVRPFARISPLLPFVTTIALGSILESLVSIFFGVQVRSFPSIADGQSIEWHGIFMTPLQLIIIASALLIFLVLGVLVHFSALGRKVRALGEHPAAAESLGISENGILFAVLSCPRSSLDTRGYL